MKVDRQIIATILALITVGMLWGMIITTDYIDSETKQNIITVQGDYPGGNAIDIYSGSLNTSQLANPDFGINQDYGWDNYSDTIYITDNDIAYYGNYQTYTGNNLYTSIVDWDDHLDYLLGPGFYEYLMITLDITNGELAESDFLRLHTTIDKRTNVEMYIYYEIDATTISEINTLTLDNDTYMFVNENAFRFEQEAYPNGTVWLVYEGYNTPLDSEDGFNQTQTSFIWSLEAITITPTDTLFGADLTEFAVWLIIVILFDVILIFKIIFSNERLDTAFGNAWEQAKKKKKG